MVMENLILEATESTPFVQFKAKEGFLEMVGRSIPEDASAFYFPLFDWLKNYSKQPADKTIMHFYLEYINSISQKMLIDLFNTISELHQKGLDLEIVWFYDEEDEEIRDEGAVYKERLQLPIELRVKK